LGKVFIDKIPVKDVDIHEYYDRQGIKLSPQRIVGTKLNTPREEDIVKAIVNLSKNSLEHSFIASLLYLTGARLCEVARYQYTGIEQERINIELPSIKIKDITPTEVQGKKIIIFDLRVEKVFKGDKEMTLIKREEKLINKPRRYVHIEYDENAPWFPLLRIIENYIETLGNKNEEYELIQMGPSNIQKFFKKVFGCNPHLFRHWRAKILTNEYGYYPQDLKLFFGWANFQMPMFYSQSEQKILLDKLSNYKMEY